MKLDLDERGRGPESLSDHLTRGVMALVRESGLGAGDRLPSVKELAERFRVATPTMREALRLLEMAGNLDIRHGSGIYVRQLEPRLMLTNPYARSLDTATIFNLLQARSVIEPPIAALAAEQAGAEQLQAMEAILKEAERNLSGNSNADTMLSRANMHFHRAIAEASGNTILAEVVFSLTELYVKEQMAVLDLYNNRSRDHDQHVLILDALRRRDAAEARQMMRDHLDEVIGVVAGRLEEDGKGMV